MPIATLATPLLYLATVVTIATACHRWVRPLARPAVAALALLPLCVTGATLLDGDAYSPVISAYADEPFAAARSLAGVEGSPQPLFLDLFSQIVPWHRAVRYAWAHGDWPLWNPFMLAGDVLAGAAQPAPFYPPNLLSLLLPLPQALTFLAALHLFLAGLGAHLFARDLGCRDATAFAAAAGWALMSGTVFWIGWPLGAAWVLLPAVLLGARRLARRPGWRSTLLLVAALALALLAGHPETAVHHLALGALYGLWEAAGRPVATWPRILAWATAGALLTVGLTAIFWLPVLDTLTQTVEWALRQGHAASAAGGLGEALRRLLPSLVPFVYGTPAERAADLPRFLSPWAGAYTGSVLLAPALYGLWLSPRRERWGLAALGLSGLAAGAQLPGFYELLGRIPPFHLTINNRLIAVAGLAVAVLAALGLETWCRRGRPAILGWLTAAVLAGLAVVLALLWVPMGEAGLSAAFRRGHGAVLLLPAAAALPFLLWRRLRPYGLAALLALLLVQRTAETSGYYPATPARAFYPPVEPLDRPLPGDTPARIVGVGWALLPNQAVHYGLEDLRGYQALHHRRFQALGELWQAERPRWYGAVNDLERARPALSLLNVRWALVPRRRPPAGWRRPRPAGEAGRLVWWRNPATLERAFLPRRVRFGVAPAQVLAEMRRTDDFAAVAWIEVPGAPPPPRPLEAVNGRGAVRLRRDGLRYTLDAELADTAWVVISNVAWRGWRAREGDRELRLAIADHALLALELGPGTHRVELFFRPRSFEVGLALTLVSAAGLGLAALLRRRRRRA